MGNTISYISTINSRKCKKHRYLLSKTVSHDDQRIAFFCEFCYKIAFCDRSFLQKQLLKGKN